MHVASETCDLLCLDLDRAEALRLHRLADEHAREAARRAAALGNPTRLALAVALAQGGELCVCDLAWIGERSIPLVSHHLRSLRAHGLVESRREGKIVFYRLTSTGAALLDAVLDAVAPLRR